MLAASEGGKLAHQRKKDGTKEEQVSSNKPDKNQIAERNVCNKLKINFLTHFQFSIIDFVSIDMI